MDTVGSCKEGTKLETMSANTDGIICESDDVCQPSIDDDTGIIYTYIYIRGLRVLERERERYIHY